MTKILLEHGIEVDSRDNHRFTPLYAASEKGHFEVAKLLIENGANVNIQGMRNYSPLHVASEIVELLLKHGAKVDCVQEKDWTPLHLACLKKRAEIVNLLLEHNANTSLTTKEGKTALEIAIYLKNEQILKIFSEYVPPGQEFSDCKDCNVCYGPKNGIFAFQPCGHAKTCQICCIKIIQDSRKCPVCRAYVKMYQKIFL